MKVFQVTDINIASLTVIADDIHHATTIVLHALYEGLRHWPKAEYTIGELDLVPSRHADTLKKWADEHRAGIVHRCNDGGWELVPPRRDDE